MSALQRSEIGESWIQPDLFLVPDLIPERKSKAISSRNCLSCINYFDGHCKEGLKGYDYDLGCERFTAYQIVCIDLDSHDCSKCNSFDFSIPDNSPWKFCLLKGKYIAKDKLETCDDFTEIIPYQAPIKTRRSRGDGSGYIAKRFLSKKTKKEIKSYEQYWYDYELWQDGVCLIKSSVYIPKKLLEEIESMEQDKKPVKAILERLGKIV